MSHRLLTVNEVACLLRVTPWSVYTWVRDGKLLPVATPGKRLLFRRQVIEQMVNSQAVECRDRTPHPAA